MSRLAWMRIRPLAMGLAVFEASFAATLDAPPRLLRSAYYDPAAPGVTVGSSLDEVRRVFGAAPDESDGSWFRTIGDGSEVNGDSKQLVYPGFSLMLLRPDDGVSEYTTSRIVIHSPNIWLTTGLSLGMSGRALRTLLGKPDLVAVDGGSGAKILHYSSSEDDDLRIHVSKGVITGIELRSR